MKIFGSITELVAAVFRKNSQAITLRPNQATTYTASRDIQLPPGDAAHVLMSANSTATMTEKTFDAEGSGNSLTNIKNSNIKAAAGIVYSKLALTDSILSADIASAEKTGSGDVVLQTSPSIASPTITGGATLRGDILLQNTSGSQPKLQLSEDPDSGSNLISVQAPTTLASDWTLTLPADDGDSGEALVTNGSGTTTWEPVVTDPTTTRGDIIRRGAAALERLAAATDNRVLAGDGTDVVSKQIDDPAFFTTGAAADGSNIGIVTTSAQTFAGLKTFSGGLINRFNHNSSSGTVTLTIADNPMQSFSAASVAVMPTTSVLAGQMWVLENRQSTDLDIQSSSTAAIVTIRTGYVMLEALQNTPTDAAHWRIVDIQYSGSYTGTYTGITTNTSATISFSRRGNTVQIDTPANAGTSNTTAFTITGMPSLIRPSAARNYRITTLVDDSGERDFTGFNVETGGTLTGYRNNNTSGFTNTNNKGTAAGTFFYTL